MLPPGGCLAPSQHHPGHHAFRCKRFTPEPGRHGDAQVVRPNTGAGDPSSPPTPPHLPTSPPPHPPTSPPPHPPQLPHTPTLTPPHSLLLAAHPLTHRRLSRCQRHGYASVLCSLSWSPPVATSFSPSTPLHQVWSASGGGLFSRRARRWGEGGCLSRPPRGEERREGGRGERRQARIFLRGIRFGSILRCNLFLNHFPHTPYSIP